MLASGRERIASVMNVGVPPAVPLPANLPKLNGLDLRARYYAARCSGDFFDAVATGSRVVFLLTDIAGRRAETFPVAMEMQHVFRAKAQELFASPSANESEGIVQLAYEANRSVMDAAHGVRFAPTFVGCFNLDLGILTYHNAGSLLAVFHDTENIRVLAPTGIPMGLFTHGTYEPVFLAFERGAKLLLVTKGVTENRRGADVFGVDQLRPLLENTALSSASGICDAVLEEANNIARTPWSRVSAFLPSGLLHRCDDMTAVALVRRPAN